MNKQNIIQQACKIAYKLYKIHSGSIDRNNSDVYDFDKYYKVILRYFNGHIIEIIKIEK